MNYTRELESIRDAVSELESIIESLEDNLLERDREIEELSTELEDLRVQVVRYEEDYNE